MIGLILATTILYYVILGVITFISEGEVFDDFTSKQLKIILYPFGFFYLCYIWIKEEIGRREKEEKSKESVD